MKVAVFRRIPPFPGWISAFPLACGALAAAVLLITVSGVRAHGTGAPARPAGVDANDNGLSDLFEMLHPGLSGAEADEDHDGMSNRQENAAGTHPRNGADRLDFLTVSQEIGGFTAEWVTQPGKQYRLQTAPTPAGPWTGAGPAQLAEGMLMRSTVPRLGTPGTGFVRLEVGDADSDGDGVTDWEERTAGTDPLVADSTGDGRGDRERITAQLLLDNRINVAAATAAASEDGNNPAVFRLTRSGNLNPLTVRYSLGGTATAGSDYQPPTGLVTFPAGAGTATLTLQPLADGLPEPAETVVLTVLPGTGYTVGTPASATAGFYDARPGLLGRYFNTQESSYPVWPATNENFDPSQLRHTRVDGPIDFDWGAGPPPGSSLDDPDGWSVRWEGRLIPPVSGPYTLHVRADRGAVLAIDGTTRISRWTTEMETENSTSPMTFTAGIPVSLRLDFRESGTTPDISGVRLSWTPPGGAREVIPFSAFTCDGSVPAQSGAPVLSGQPFAYALRGAPFFWQAVSSDAAATFAADGLPAGLALDPATGAITGITTEPVGLRMATVTASTPHGTAIMPLPVHILEAGGGLTREVWAMSGGTGSGTESIPVSSPPSAVSTVTSLQAPPQAGDQFGDRLRGFLTVPVSGPYTFFLSGDESAEFWLSSSAEPGERLKRCWLHESGHAPGTWNALAGQKSLAARLTAGRRYYLEVLRRETSGPDHLAVGWLRPGQSGPGPSEIVPGWALSPWAAPPAELPDGTLYTATLTPQSGAATLGTGSATLFVHADRTHAELSFTFSNLTGPIISQHLHDSRPLPGPSGAIVFDIDDSEPEASGARHWEFAPTGSHTVEDILASIEQGTCYLNLHTATYPNGEVKGFFLPAGGSQFFTPPAAPPAAVLDLPADPPARMEEIARFLHQCTFGARPDTDGLRSPGATDAQPFGGWDPDSIEAVASRGYAQWLDDQLAMDPGPDPETVILQPLPPGTVYSAVSASRRLPNADTAAHNGSGPLATFVRQYYQRYPRSGAEGFGTSTESEAELWRAWWKASCTAPDQVRHRMAWALSQILVVSEEGVLDGRARALAHYYDLLYWHGLGNFRTLLERVTLNPAMGRYLDMLGNRRPNPSTGRIPNENYAREILQLFSIGLKRLHPDGTLVLDSRGLPLDTYGQEHVVGFAHTFTGWNFHPAGGSANYISAMQPRPEDHDTGEKLLLENAVLPANPAPSVDSCNAALQAAHDVIFHHPNTGPFICRQLIQRLVTSNPSPAYVYRTASAFADDGTGVRGNMKAVLRAILLDPEARNAAPRQQPGYGKLKEPVLRATQMMRAFRVFSHAESVHASARDLGAAIFSPSGNINLSVPLRTAAVTYTTGTPETVTSSYLDDTIDPDGLAGAQSPAGFSFVLAPGNLVLLRRQTAPPASGALVADPNGDTNSPENGLYLFTGNGEPLKRAPQADTAAELTNAWVILITTRLDAPGTPGGSPIPGASDGGSLTDVRYYRQTATPATLGADPVQFTLNPRGNDHRHLWEMGSVRSVFQQNPLRSPTVFNFYEPDHRHPGLTGGAGLYGPEFQITSETSAITTASWFYNLTRRNSSDPSSPFSYGQGYAYPDPEKRELKLNLTAERAMAADAGALTDHLARRLMPGQMTPPLRNLLVSYLNTLPAGTDAEKMNRLGEALYLFALTPETAVQR